MFSVIFEVHPKAEQWDAYLGNAKMLRPELEQVDGFVDNIRYKSLTRAGWILSLSGWRDEKSVVRWRTAHAASHGAGEGPLRDPARLSPPRRPRSRATPRPAGQAIAGAAPRRNGGRRGHDRYLDRCQMAADVG